MKPHRLSVRVHGEEGTGKNTLVSALDGCMYTRVQDKRSFIFDAQLGTSSTSHTSVAIVLVDATTPFRLSSSTVQRAMESASSLCILFTKIDLIARDNSFAHLTYLGCMRTLAYQHNVDCLSASLTTKEGISDLIAYTVNAVAPLLQRRSFHLSSFLKQFQSFILDCIAACFALPTRQMTSNIDEELAAISSDDDIHRLSASTMSTAWWESLKSRLGVEHAVGAPAKRITPSLVVKRLSTSERVNMEYVRRHTSIPVPRVHLPHLSWLIMDFIEGEMLSERWDRLSRFMQFRVGCTLRLYVKQLRSLRRLAVGGVDNGLVTGAFFEFNDYGPFDTAARFRRFCDRVSFDGWKSSVLAMQYCGKAPPPLPQSSADWTPVFTHGDLNTSNILLDKQGTLWLIDWATAGFYPACVESLSMLRCNKLHDISPSWKQYRWFITGTTSEEEEGYWFSIEGAIHRYHATSM